MIFLLKILFQCMEERQAIQIQLEEHITSLWKKLQVKGKQILNYFLMLFFKIINKNS